MNNKINESNDYKCVLCETGEGDRHGLLCSENKLTKIEILEKLSKSFNEEDKKEPFIDRGYVEETKKIYGYLINGGIDQYDQRAINDIVSDIFRHFKTKGHTEI